MALIRSVIRGVGAYLPAKVLTNDDLSKMVETEDWKTLAKDNGLVTQNLQDDKFEAYLKEQTDGPSRINRRVTVRRITPLLTGDAAPPR